MGVMNKFAASSGLDIYLATVCDSENKQQVAFMTQARIIDRNMGVLMPEAYMPVAEKTAKAKQIVMFSVKKSILIMDKLLDRDVEFDFFCFQCMEAFLVDVNVLEEFKQIIENSNIGFEKIVFCISPKILLSKNELVFQNMQNLRELGVRFALKNFGCDGFPTSKVLKAPIDIVILDEFLVDCLMGTEIEQQFAHGNIEMIRRLNFKVMIEDVKTQATFDKLKEHCDYVTGELLGKYKKDRYVRKK